MRVLIKISSEGKIGQIRIESATILAISVRESHQSFRAILLLFKTTWGVLIVWQVCILDTDSALFGLFWHNWLFLVHIFDG